LALRRLGAPVNEGWVRRVFKKWRFTSKNIKWRSPSKFTYSNILDEARFERGDLRRQKGFAVAGRGIAMEDRAENPKISYTVTLVTDPSHPAGFVVSEPRLESNTAADFLEFVVVLILRGVLVRGDFFIVDNASIHFSEEIEPALEAVLDVSGVRACGVCSCLHVIRSRLCFCQRTRPN